MIIDALIDAIIAKNNPTVAGLDTRAGHLPAPFAKKYFESADDTHGVCSAILDYNKALIDALSGIVPAVKLQLACYELLGAEGLSVYAKTISYAKSKGLITIADGKRNDIGSTAEAYALAHIAPGDFEADFLTVNPYLGTDGVKPFTDICEKGDKGIFVLIQTSNPSSGEFQDMRFTDGRTLYEAVGDMAVKWGEGCVGKYGYSSVGGVVGATYPEEGRALRKRLPSVFFLIPGFGAQGASADDIAGCFDGRGIGGIVNSSRAILTAHRARKTDDFVSAAANEALSMKAALCAAIDKVKA